VQAPAVVVVWKNDGLEFLCFAAKIVGSLQNGEVRTENMKSVVD
jgi:hypothetical protein